MFRLKTKAHQCCPTVSQHIYPPLELGTSPCLIKLILSLFSLISISRYYSIIILLGSKVAIHKGLGKNVGLSNITFHFPMSNLIDWGSCNLYNYQKYKSDNFIFRFIMNNIFLSTCKMKPLQLP